MLPSAVQVLSDEDDTPVSQELREGLRMCWTTHLFPVQRSASARRPASPLDLADPTAVHADGEEQYTAVSRPLRPDPECWICQVRPFRCPPASAIHGDQQCRRNDR